MKTQKTQENQAVSPFSFPGGTGNRFCKSHSYQPRKPAVKSTSFRLHCDEIPYEHNPQCIFLFREAVSVLSVKPFCKTQECLAVNPNESSSLQFILDSIHYTSLISICYSFFDITQNMQMTGIPKLLLRFTLFFVLHGPNQNY